MDMLLFGLIIFLSGYALGYAYCWIDRTEGWKDEREESQAASEDVSRR